jgi:hypothetical protein
MSKTSLLLVFLFLAALVFNEVPEHLRLQDDASNDFTVSACKRLSFEPASISEESAPNSTSGPVEADPTRIVQYFRFPLAAEPFHLSGQDCLLLWSIQRT